MTYLKVKDFNKWSQTLSHNLDKLTDIFNHNVTKISDKADILCTDMKEIKTRQDILDKTLTEIKTNAKWTSWLSKGVFMAIIAIIIGAIISYIKG